MINRSSTNTNPDDTLIRNSMNYLQNYREAQAALLKQRLTVFTNAVIKKYGSLDKLKCDEGSPIESKNDIDIIDRIVKLQTFIMIPIYNSANGITHFYTLGMWYYWGLPEILITFDKPVFENMYESINIFTNIIHDELFYMFRNRIVNRVIKNKNHTIKVSNDIHRIDFCSEPDTLKITLEKFDLEFELKRIEQGRYIDIKAVYMMWFYMYYMDAIKDKKNEPTLYPVYELKINEGNYRTACKQIVDVLMTKVMSTKTVKTKDDESTDSIDSIDSVDSVDSDTPVIIESCDTETEIKIVPTSTNTSSESVSFQIKKKGW